MKTVAALLDDSNPIHWDKATVRALGMGDRLVNQGTSNLAYVVNMIVAWTGTPAAVRRLRVRFLANVLEGERVVARGRVTRLLGVPGARTAELEVWLERGDDRMLEGVATVALD
jgi:acyl dehydratase